MIGKTGYAIIQHDPNFIPMIYPVEILDVILSGEKYFVTYKDDKSNVSYNTDIDKTNFHFTFISALSDYFTLGYNILEMGVSKLSELNISKDKRDELISLLLFNLFDPTDQIMPLLNGFCEAIRLVAKPYESGEIVINEEK